MYQSVYWINLGGLLGVASRRRRPAAPNAIGHADVQRVTMNAAAMNPDKLHPLVPVASLAVPLVLCHVGCERLSSL